MKNKINDMYIIQDKISLTLKKIGYRFSEAKDLPKSHNYYAKILCFLTGSPKGFLKYM